MNNNQANILVVDDTPDNLRLLGAILTDQGYRVRKALNGQTALKTVRTVPPDLILLDINMPGMNGYEVCQELKADEKTKEIPVIFISALDDVLDKVKAFNVGGVDYITKPFQGEEVIARIDNQLTIQQLQKQLKSQNALLRQEQEKSESLLLNILPKSIVEQLKENPNLIAEQYDEATFLFADIVGFTGLSSPMSPEEVVKLLNEIFSSFDQIVERQGLEKIRTIGDSYFVAGGLPMRRADHAEAVAEMALEMQQAIARFQWSNSESIQLRVGINTGGPVVAAVIGIKKFAYDVWGDTVNIASRMESQGVPGKIQVTAATYERLRDKYLFEERGTIAVRGKGEMSTYWLLGKKSE